MARATEECMGHGTEKKSVVANGASLYYVRQGTGPPPAFYRWIDRRRRQFHSDSWPVGKQIAHVQPVGR